MEEGGDISLVYLLVKIGISPQRPHSHDIIEPKLPLPRHSLPPSSITFEIKDLTHDFYDIHEDKKQTTKQLENRIRHYFIKKDI